MKCHHCCTDFHDYNSYYKIGKDTDGEWAIGSCTCSACKRDIYSLICARIVAVDGNGVRLIDVKHRYIVRPKASFRPSPSPDVPKDYSEDYIEACLVLGDSPKASAALSRRCLQNILRGVAAVTPADLAKEIQEALDKKMFPSYISESLDAVRNIGNFAAHPLKSKSTGEIVPVEPGEAEWTLDVLDSLFDFYFVQPSILKRKRDALNKKLGDMGKPPMKK